MPDKNTNSTFDLKRFSRRTALCAAGAIASGSVVGSMMYNESNPKSISQAIPASGTTAGKAKRVIYLYQAGAPSQLDMFDYKPKTRQCHGTSLPTSVRNGQRLTEQTAEQESLQIAASPFQFKQRGQSGLWVSNLLPNTARIADDICMIKSMHTDAINHVQGASFLLTGNEKAGSPSIGAWLSYALGSDNPNLPTSAVMISLGSGLGNGGQPILDRYWSNGFLPAEYRGVKFRGVGDPVLYLKNPAGIDSNIRNQMVNTISQLNKLHFEKKNDPQTLARTKQFEMALKMQDAIPDLTNLADEPEHTFKHYGPGSKTPGTYAANCLLARRMAQKGVRFIQLCHRGWDTHSNNNREVALQCKDVDQASAALVEDLKMRGMLDDTLVIFGSEFGRTVYSQGEVTTPNFGRDHHPRCFCVWMAGGGIKPGMTYGETDDLGYNVTSNPVHINDLNATILHCLGIDHQRLTFRYLGRENRLTGTGGKVVHEILNAPQFV